jgi:hypothetical protein
VGPIAGIVLLLGTDLPATLINVVSSILFALAMPVAANGSRVPVLRPRRRDAGVTWIR